MKPQDRKKLIIRLWKQNKPGKAKWSKNKIAIKAKCSRPYVYQVLMKAGLYGR